MVQHTNICKMLHFFKVTTSACLAAVRATAARARVHVSEVSCKFADAYDLMGVVPGDGTGRGRGGWSRSLLFTTWSTSWSPEVCPSIVLRAGRQFRQLFPAHSFSRSNRSLCAFVITCWCGFPCRSLGNCDRRTLRGNCCPGGRRDFRAPMCAF